MVRGFMGAGRQEMMGDVLPLSIKSFLPTKKSGSQGKQKISRSGFVAESTGFANLHWINARANVHHSCR